MLQLESRHGVTAGIPPRCHSWNHPTVLQPNSPHGVTAGIPPRCYSWNHPTVLQLNSPHGVTAGTPPRCYSWNPKLLRAKTCGMQPLSGSRLGRIPCCCRRGSAGKHARTGEDAPDPPPSTDRLGPEPTQKNHLPFALFSQNAAKSAGRNYPRSLASQHGLAKSAKNLRHATPFRQPAGTHSLLLPARIRRKARSNRRGCS